MWIWSLSLWKISWSRKCQPTPVFLPGKFHGQRSWWATVQEVSKSQTQQSARAHIKHRHVLAKTDKQTPQTSSSSYPALPEVSTILICSVSFQNFSYAFSNKHKYLKIFEYLTFFLYVFFFHILCVSSILLYNFFKKINHISWRSFLINMHGPHTSSSQRPIII